MLDGGADCRPPSSTGVLLRFCPLVEVSACELSILDASVRYYCGWSAFNVTTVPGDNGRSGRGWNGMENLPALLHDPAQLNCSLLSSIILYLSEDTPHNSSRLRGKGHCSTSSRPRCGKVDEVRSSAAEDSFRAGQTGLNLR